MSRTRDLDDPDGKGRSAQVEDERYEEKLLAKSASDVRVKLNDQDTCLSAATSCFKTIITTVLAAGIRVFLTAGMHAAGGRMKLYYTTRVSTPASTHTVHGPKSLYRLQLLTVAVTICKYGRS